MQYPESQNFLDPAHCVPDVVWGHWKYMGFEICHLIGLNAHKPKCYFKNSKKKFLGEIWV